MNESTAQERREIASMRRILRPSQVKVGQLPKWADPVYWIGRYPWFDHFGTTKAGDWKCCHDAVARFGHLFVIEPYQADFEDLRAIQNACVTNGLIWHLSANSWHYPGHTLRIIIHPAIPASLRTMISPRKLFHQAQSFGLYLGADGNDLLVRPADKCPPEFAALLREHKAALVDWLTYSPDEALDPEAIARVNSGRTWTRRRPKSG